MKSVVPAVLESLQHSRVARSAGDVTRRIATIRVDVRFSPAYDECRFRSRSVAGAAVQAGCRGCHRRRAHPQFHTLPCKWLQSRHYLPACLPALASLCLWCYQLVHVDTVLLRGIGRLPGYVLCRYSCTIIHLNLMWVAQTHVHWCGLKHGTRALACSTHCT